DAVKRPPIAPYMCQKRFSKKHYEEIFYPSLRDQDQSLLAMSFLVCPIWDSAVSRKLQLLDAILMGSDAGLLKSVLFQSGLWKQARSGIDTLRAEVSYTLLIEGVKPEDREALEKLIFATLQKIKREGIQEALIASAANKLELERREIGQSPEPLEQSLFAK